MIKPKRCSKVYTCTKCYRNIFNIFNRSTWFCTQPYTKSMLYECKRCSDEVAYG